MPSRITKNLVIGSLLAVGSIQAAMACTAPPGASECTLQGYLDDYFTPAARPQVSSALADPADAKWNIIGSNSSSTIIMEIAGYNAQNTFGIYDPNAGQQNNKLTVFVGGEGAGDSNTLLASSNGNGTWTFTLTNAGARNGQSITIAGSSFGFFLSTPEGGGAGQTYYSQTPLNSDGFDHLKAIKGNNETFSNLAPSPLPGTKLTTFDYLLAWEDLKNGGDKDYQDMALIVRNVGPAAVPLPAAAWLLMSGIAGVAAIGRRRKSRGEATAA